jgi:eukaryotic-like serine/threonine-protein kinase
LPAETNLMENSNIQEIICPSCHTSFVVSQNSSNSLPKFCSCCGTNLSPSSLLIKEGSEQSLATSHDSPSLGSVTFIPGHIPKLESIKFSIGPYQILENIGKGGMGEVFLAYDTTCGRRIALKRIRPDLQEYKQLHNRFLKEARITSQLTHPAIIPIYAIHGQDNLVYYTMPFVEGQTLKQILRKTRQQEKKGEPLDHIGGSIPALIRIFISICQAVAYAHSKGVLHRDLKPENIIVGQFGEVLILDWGLAKLINSGSEEEKISDSEEEKFQFHPLHQLTNVGKVVGTVAYMAPERATGHPATFKTDIYSLGVILYQILTLRHPFRRGTLKQYREKMGDEKLYEPTEVAPYRDVPRLLSRVVMKCLNNSVIQRYDTVNEMIHDLENYIEGRSEWYPIAELDIKNKSDWEFQENVLIAEHIAITRGAEVSDWVSLMISKASFLENTKIEAKIKIGEKGHGIGFLMCIPEASERINLNDGYCFWLGSDLNKSTKLLRSTVEVMHCPDTMLLRHEWYDIKIEKIDTNIHFYLNGALQFSYISHQPLLGTHIGLLSRDADFTLSPIQVFVRGQNIMVNCLAVPDAFLAHKDYATAFTEYQRIASSFPGRAEGHQAIFRAGVTLLEEGRNSDTIEKAEALYELALKEFEKLHKTSAAPLEYLGKALVYQALKDYEEEAKCFELAYRRYHNHPMLRVLEEQVVYRMHDSSRFHRKATYKFMLLAIRHIQNISITTNASKLINNLQKYWEYLPFIEEDFGDHDPSFSKNLNFGTKLAFWLAKPYILSEIIDELKDKPDPSIIAICNALFCQIELGSWELARRKISELSTYSKIQNVENANYDFALLEIAISAHYSSLSDAVDKFFALVKKTETLKEERIILHLMEIGINTHCTKIIHQISHNLFMEELEPNFHLRVNSNIIWAYLLEENYSKAGEVLHTYPLETLTSETSPLHFLYGCWLYATEGKEIANIHFTGLLEISYPRSWTLLGHYLNGRLPEDHPWFKKAFLWERRQLFRQLSLFFHCIKEDSKSLVFQKLERNEYLEFID